MGNSQHSLDDSFGCVAIPIGIYRSRHFLVGFTIFQ